MTDALRAKPTMIELLPDEIHLWFTFVDEVHDDGLLGRYRSLLTKQERQKEQGFHFQADRHRYLVTRALVRTVLSRYLDKAPESWFFVQDSFGKPVIGNGIPMAQKIEFNISHTEGLIVCGVRSGGALGVDIERLNNRPALLNIADEYFSAIEKKALTLLPDELKVERLFQYWTLKESYIKARGCGLSIPLNKFGFHFYQTGRASLFVDRQLEDQPSSWRFWQLRPSPEHLAAVCAKRSANDCQRLIVRKVVPFRSEQTLNYVAVLESD
jgi:4'-phosphopantetheinyl transferase